MNKKTLFGLIILSQFSFAKPLLAKPLIMEPEISPDGEQVAFSYQGDIWKVNLAGGRADRLTIHEGYESAPKWNTTSNKIAFSSDRYGNNDIFVMGASGGQPLRLTHHSASDSIISFTADDTILFNTRRIYAQVEGYEAIVSMVSLGLGVGVVPKIVLDNSPLLKRIRVLNVSPELEPFDVGLFTLKRNLNNPLVDAFWNAVG